ncbi:RsmB/NOP family class I SAM-dependent RNA methyltransferase [Ponticoccus litoralis]|uniref:RsmB/NOP family class I SAM-dependent RNA methyltransferase n=1 Tax=Ponticoccus litoralis TaxID=422297 RepID=A0AAW9SVB9_9RHOB
MTPAARVQTAIEILDRIALGVPAEKALTTWGRRARFAGSGDRAAVRDHVFDVLRRWRSTAALGGGDSGRARMLGLLRMQEAAPEALFSGDRHAPAPLTEAEQVAGQTPEGAAALDLPDWLAERFRASLGARAGAVAEALRHRADVFLRVNLLRGDLTAALAALSGEGITAEPHDLSPTALRVTEGARRIARSQAYLSGLVELQDAASQAVVDALPLTPGARVLDFCAGGGGKTLALAARLGGSPVEAHDADPARMKDLPGRADRAGAAVRLRAAPAGSYDLVLCDVPCSGSGAWRRAPEGKWRLTPDALQAVCREQAAILETCAGLVAPGGHLAYATCSVLQEENAARIAAFTADHPAWTAITERQFLPQDGGDGFYVAVLTRR